ncbi:oligosaccharide repeat unit polymerase [Devosia sp. YR412]|uniref:O-antigen polysaccharide polymerase Wzy n=1 Tax=Devosia sp. YR412 TaxID=1881030 RepID=UPI0008AEDCAC|nr:O-antigen polysaccharide polymerase Wzy [Devosia sp. YR412]SEQ53601.1 oligosaccharide repeat unit polymerase [Devosia sp. YR412]
MKSRNIVSRGLSTFVQTVLILLLIASFYGMPKGLSPAVAWSCLIVFYYIFWEAIQKPTIIAEGIPTYFTIELLFYVFYYILYYYPYQLHVLSLNEIARSTVFTNTFVDESNSAIIAATIGIVAFRIGLKSVQNLPTQITMKPNFNYSNLPVVTMAGLAGLISLYQLSGWRSDGEGRYTGTTSGGVLAEGVTTIIMILGMITIGTTIANLVQKRKISLPLWISIGLTLYWTVRILSFGDRNSFLLLAIAAVGGMLTYRVHAGRNVLFGLIFVGLSFYNVIEIIRMSPDFSLDGISEAYEISSSKNAEDSSFNFTTIAARASFAAVPDVFDYGYGFYKLVGFSGIFPFVRGFLLDGSQLFTTSTDVLTYVVLGPNATWSLGTNTISDIYLDFGIFGVPIAMFFVGCFVARVRRYATLNPKSTTAIIIYLMTLALMAELPRYSLDFPVRMLAWAALLLWGYRLVTRKPIPAVETFVLPVETTSSRG